MLMGVIALADDRLHGLASVQIHHQRCDQVGGPGRVLVQRENRQAEDIFADRGLPAWGQSRQFQIGGRVE